MEEQRRWWRLAARAKQFQLTSQDKIILRQGLDIIRCYGAQGLQTQQSWRPTKQPLLSPLSSSQSKPRYNGQSVDLDGIGRKLMDPMGFGLLTSVI